MSNIPPGAILDKPSAVMERVGNKKSWLHNRIKTDPTFPRPVYISPREPRFFRHEIDAWMQQQAAKREQVAQESEHATT